MTGGSSVAKNRAQSQGRFRPVILFIGEQPIESLAETVAVRRDESIRTPNSSEDMPSHTTPSVAESRSHDHQRETNAADTNHSDAA